MAQPTATDYFKLKKNDLFYTTLEYPVASDHSWVKARTDEFIQSELTDREWIAIMKVEILHMDVTCDEAEYIQALREKLLEKFTVFYN